MRLALELMFYILGWAFCCIAIGLYLTKAIVMAPVRAVDDADQLMVRITRSRRFRRLTDWVP
jgi:hypothetical protein